MWETLAGQVRADGSVSVQTAVEAFSRAIGPLPGAAAAPEGRQTPIDTGGGPVRWLQQHWAELDAAQRSAASRYLRPPRTLAARVGATPAAGIAIANLGDSPGAGAYRTIVNDAIARIGSATGTSLLAATAIVLGAIPPPQTVGAWAYAEPFDAGGNQVGPETECLIFINQRMVQASPDIQRATLAHETFHCFEAQMIGSVAAYLSAPSWLVEGQAEWVGETYAGGTSVSGQWWHRYLTTPLAPLFQRSYDAIGFYAHLAENGVDPWRQFASMLTAGGSAAAYARAVAGHEPAFLDRWAAGLSREAGWGVGWNTTGPGITQDKPDVQTTTVGSFSDTVDPYTNNVSQADVVAEVVTFSFQGYGRLHTSDDKTYHASELDGRSFCTRSGGCAGSGGCAASAHLPAMAPGMAYLAMSAGADVTSFRVEGRDLATFCSKPQPTPTLTPTPSPSATAGGSCPGVSNAELSQALGGSVTGTNTTTDLPHGLLVCGFLGPTGRGAITVTDSSTFDIEIKDPRCARIDIGQGACAIGFFLYMHANERYYAISVETSRGPAVDSAATIQLANEVAANP
jgi:hypothetical protein